MLTIMFSNAQQELLSVTENVISKKERFDKNKWHMKRGGNEHMGMTGLSRS